MLTFVYWLKSAMQGFTEKIVQMMKEHRFFASQGGPIILSQVLYKFTNLFFFFVTLLKRFDL